MSKEVEDPQKERTPSIPLQGRTPSVPQKERTPSVPLQGEE